MALKPRPNQHHRAPAPTAHDPLSHRRNIRETKRCPRCMLVSTSLVHCGSYIGGNSGREKSILACRPAGLLILAATAPASCHPRRNEAELPSPLQRTITRKNDAAFSLLRGTGLERQLTRSDSRSVHAHDCELRGKNGKPSFPFLHRSSQSCMKGKEYWRTSSKELRRASRDSRVRHSCLNPSKGPSVLT